jgi:hypothetical protein
MQADDGHVAAAELDVLVGRAHDHDLVVGLHDHVVGFIPAIAADRRILRDDVIAARAEHGVERAGLIQAADGEIAVLRAVPVVDGTAADDDDVVVRVDRHAVGEVVVAVTLAGVGVEVDDRLAVAGETLVPFPVGVVAEGDEVVTVRFRNITNQDRPTL